MHGSLQAIVVGAGAAGLGCALALARAGARVRVVAAGAPRASLAAAGMLGPISEAALEPNGAHPLGVDLGLEGLDRWGAMAPALAIPLRRGCRLLHRPETLARAAALAERAGWRPIADAGSLRLQEEAVLEAPAAAARLIRAAAAAGAQRVQAQALAPLWREDRVIGVLIEGGEALEADFVVLAPGHGRSTVWAEAAPALRALTPARGCIVAVEQAPAGDPPVLRTPEVYLAAQPGGRLLAGASMEFGVDDAQPDPTIAARLHAAAVARRPDLEALPWRAHAGVRAMSPDWAPLLGPAGAPGLFLAAGMGRNGWLLSLLAGEIISAYVFEQPIAPLYAAFSPDRLRPS